MNAAQQKLDDLLFNADKALQDTRLRDLVTVEAIQILYQSNQY